MEIWIGHGFGVRKLSSKTGSQADDALFPPVFLKLRPVTLFAARIGRTSRNGFFFSETAPRDAICGKNRGRTGGEPGERGRTGGEPGEPRGLRGRTGGT